MKLRDKIAFITGCGDGIGKAIALKFAEEGAKVIITYNKNKEGILRVERQIMEKGKGAFALQLDISSVESIESAINIAIEKFGRIDILVNNAGISIREDILETKEESWDQTMKVNLKGCFFCSQIAVRKMLSQREGKIINISSNAANKIRNHGFAYTLSKVGIDYLTKSFALTFAPYINVNAIAPGHTFTPMSLTTHDEEIRKRVEGEIPLHRINSPEDIAELAVFLASESARNITGEVIKVDGGDSLINKR